MPRPPPVPSSPEHRIGEHRRPFSTVSSTYTYRSESPASTIRSSASTRSVASARSSASRHATQSPNVSRAQSRAASMRYIDSRGKSIAAPPGWPVPSLPRASSRPPHPDSGCVRRPIEITPRVRPRRMGPRDRDSFLAQDDEPIGVDLSVLGHDANYIPPHHFQNKWVEKPRNKDTNVNFKRELHMRDPTVQGQFAPRYDVTGRTGLPNKVAREMRKEEYDQRRKRPQPSPQKDSGCCLVM